MEQDQLEICRLYSARFTPPDNMQKLGISKSALQGEIPINGLRHPPENGTSGWFIWSGEWSDAPDFFLPMHLSHLPEHCPAAVPFLALPPGWRFLAAPGYRDVWFDENLLNI
jgi:hypothetical protein